SSEGEEEGEKGVSEDLEEGDVWTTEGGTRVVLSGSFGFGSIFVSTNLPWRIDLELGFDWNFEHGFDYIPDFDYNNYPG
ncbi:hypothetical protein Tco_0186624, partial [Tanacetum coccineum]